jgi:hypothetical protein
MAILNWPSILNGVLGGVLSSAAMFRWLGERILAKEKATHEKTLEEMKSQYARELERLKAEIDRSVFVTRAQSETEFDAYKQAFEALAQVRIAMGMTRPMFSVNPEGETDEARRKRLFVRLGQLVDAQDKAVAVVENLSPFYPAEIYSRIMHGCLKASGLAILDIRTAKDDTFSMGWFQQGERRMDEFMSAYDAVSNMIRSRIATLAILPRR